MSELVRMVALTGYVDRPVVDRTGLTGIYEMLLEFDNPLKLRAGDAGAAPSSAVVQDIGAAMLNAMRDQLGLKVEPRREEVEVLVIDSVSMPEPD